MGKQTLKGLRSIALRLTSGPFYDTVDSLYSLCFPPKGDKCLYGTVDSPFRHLSPFGGKQSEYESVDSLPLRGTNSAIKGTVNTSLA